MGTVYSSRIAIFNGDASAGVVIYTAPATGVPVLRDISVRNSGTAATSIQLYVTSGPTVATIMEWANVAVQAVAEWQGRHVLVAGDELAVYSLEGNVQLLASGYLLNS